MVALALLTGCAGHTLDATDVRPTSAMLNGAGQCDYGCNVRFRYHEVSPSLQGFSYTPAKPIPGGAKGNFSLPVSGLTPGATYHFQICGTDANIQGELCTGPTEDGSSYSRFVTPQPMRLETYNVEYFKELDGNGGDNYPATDAAIEKIKDDINTSGATVVALEEVRQFGKNSKSEAERIADALGWKGTGGHVLYVGWGGDPNGCSPNPACTSKGVAIISAYPITDPHNQSLFLDYGLDRQLIWGDINLDGGKKVRVYAAHLAAIHPDERLRTDEAYTARQLKKAVDIVKFTMTGSGLSKAVFMGDFNLPYDSYVAGQPLHAFDPLTSYGFQDWKAQRISLADPCAAPYYACTYSNFNSSHQPAAAYDKRDYVWVKGYTMTAGSVPKYCTSTTCDSDHRPYWTDITP